MVEAHLEKLSNGTAIEWTHRPGTKGETWNPLAGCSILTPGCTSCYAMRMAGRIEAINAAVGKPTHYAGTTRKVNGKTVWTGKVALAPDHILTAPLRWKSPRTVFVNSMSDLFHEDVPDEWIDRIFNIMAVCPQNTFQVLTKRARRMREYLSSFRLATAASGFLTRNGAEPTSYGGPIEYGIFNPERWPLPNVWLGVSAERQKEADDRIPELLATPAAIRFVSAEPLLGPIDFNAMAEGVENLNALSGLRENPFGDIVGRRYGTRLDWIIVGGESGPDARPMHPAWARSIRDQCATEGTAFFFKQWGKWADIDQSPAADEAGWQGRGNWMILDKHGELDIPDHRWPDEEAGECAVIDVGKKRSGRLLDGVEHSAYPVIGDR